MSIDHRTELVRALNELAQRFPEWRFGQLVANVADWADRGVWDVEDEQLLKAAKEHLDQGASGRVEIRASA